MYLPLLWVSSLLCLALCVAFSWCARRKDGSPITWVSVVGSAAVLLVATVPVGIALWAHLSFLRPSHLVHMTIWWGLLFLWAALCAVFRSRLTGGAGLKLFGASLVAGTLSIVLFVAADRARVGELERELEAAERRCREILPGIKAGEDARPIYERAFEALRGAGKVPPWAADPAHALRTRPEEVEKLLRDTAGAMEIVRQARAYPSLSAPEGPVGGIFTSFAVVAGLRPVLSILHLRITVAAAAGNVDEVRDGIAWLGDLSKQFVTGPGPFYFLLGAAVEASRIRAFEAGLAAGGQGKLAALCRSPPALPAGMPEIAQRQVQLESSALTRDLIKLWLSPGLPEGPPSDPFSQILDDSPLGRPFAGRFAGKAWLAFYRVFVLRYDLDSLGLNEEEALRRWRADSAKASFYPEGGEQARVGVGPTSGIFVSVLYTPRRETLRVATMARLAQLGAVIEAYRGKTGEYPPRLEEIPKDDLPEIPRDAYYGEPLLYEREDSGGAVIWSTWSGKDVLPDHPARQSWSWRAAVEQGSQMVFCLGSSFSRHVLERELAEARRGSQGARGSGRNNGRPPNRGMSLPPGVPDPF